MSSFYMHVSQSPALCYLRPSPSTCFSPITHQGPAVGDSQGCSRQRSGMRVPRYTEYGDDTFKCKHRSCWEGDRKEKSWGKVGKNKELGSPVKGWFWPPWKVELA